MKIFSRLRDLKQNMRGDTIVEVLISIAILTVVLGTAYAISSHSLQTGTTSTQRDQALGYAQRQVEFIKTVQSKASSADTILYTQINPPFCILNDGTTAPYATTTATTSCQKYDGSSNGNSTSPYKVAVSYNSTSRIFTISVSWAAANSNSLPGQLQLFYKLPSNFTAPVTPSEPSPTPTPIGGGDCIGTRTHSPVGYQGANVCIHFFNGGTGTIHVYIDSATCEFSPGVSYSCPGVGGNGGDVIVPASAGGYSVKATGGGGEVVEYSTTVGSATPTPAPTPTPTPPQYVSRVGCWLGNPNNSRTVLTTPCSPPYVPNFGYGPQDYCWDTINQSVMYWAKCVSQN